MSLIQVASSGAVRTVTISRPEKRNALTSEMMSRLNELFRVEPPAAERVTVIRSEGSAFCAGLELSTKGVDKAAADEIEAMFDAVQCYPLPVVARVQGAAIAGGCELALHCDFVVAANAAKFAMPLAKLGVATTWFLTKKIMETGGPVAARQLLLLGDPITGAALEAMNLIAFAVEADELDKQTDVVVNRLSANAPLSMRAMKAVILQQLKVLDGIDHGRVDSMVDSAWASADALEGVSAMVQRRTPRFTGS